MGTVWRKEWNEIQWLCHGSENMAVEVLRVTGGPGWMWQCKCHAPGKPDHVHAKSGESWAESGLNLPVAADSPYLSRLKTEDLSLLGHLAFLLCGYLSLNSSLLGWGSLWVGFMAFHKKSCYLWSAQYVPYAILNILNRSCLSFLKLITFYRCKYSEEKVIFSCSHGWKILRLISKSRSI